MKSILTILLFISFSASAQMEMFHAHNQSGCDALGYSDSLPQVIYSFRKVNSCYSDNVVKIRRASDNTTSIFGFSGNFVDTAAIKSFIGASDAFVERWYNQGVLGSTRDVIQTTNSQQPKIASSGALIYANGHLVMDFDGSNDILVCDIFFVVQDSFTLLGVAQRKSTTIFGALIINNASSANTSGVFVYYPTNQTLASFYGSGGYKDVKVGTTTTDLCFVGNYANSSSLMASDGTSTATLALSSETIRPSNITIGGTKRIGVNYYYNGRVSEAIGYSADMRNRRTGLESNIKTFYGL